MSGSPLREYRTITGRKFDLGKLTAEERKFLAAARGYFHEHPSWTRFASWWVARFDKSGLGDGSPVYRICQDLEARIGIQQGKVAPPDYRDFLADLIEAVYGSRYQLCKQTGVDAGQLSRVLSGRGDFSMEMLNKLLDLLQAVLTIQPVQDARQSASPEEAEEALAAVEA